MDSTKIGLNPTGSDPIVIVEFGNLNVTGNYFISFQSKPLDTPSEVLGEYNTETSQNQLTLNPKELLDPPSNNVEDLIDCYVGWSVFLYTFVNVIPEFKFSLKVQQSSKDIITPVVITQKSTNDILVAKASDGSTQLIISFADFRKIVKET
jgi:hypothetical protein